MGPSRRFDVRAEVCHTMASDWRLVRRGNGGCVRRRRIGLRVVIFIRFRRAVFVRSAVNHGLEVEVAVARWAWALPFERVAVPRISASSRAEENAVEEVDGEDDLGADH